MVTRIHNLFMKIQGHGAGDEFRPLALPGLVIPVDDLARGGR